MDLRQSLGTLRARWRFLIAVALLGLGSTVWLLDSMTPRYASSATIFVSTPPRAINNARAVSLLIEGRTLSYAHMATDSSVLRRSAERLGGGLTAKDLRQDLSAEAVESTLLVVIEARAESSMRAQQVATVVADETLRLIREVEGDRDDTDLPIVATLASEPTGSTAQAEPDLLFGGTVGVVLSLLTALAAALLREALDKAVRTADDVYAATGRPPLATVPSAANRSDETRSTGRRRDPVGEAFNLLRTNLQFAEIEASLKTLLVTTARPGEDGAIVARNLATAMARVGRSVFLLDADLRSAPISASVDSSNDGGLFAVLAQQVTLDDAVSVDDMGVHVLPAGAAPPNPAAVLDTAVMRHLVAQLRQKYDVVVIVTSAVLVYADASGLLSEVDGTLLVVPYGSSRDWLEQATVRIAQAGGRLSGVVVSGVPKSAAMTYGARPRNRKASEPKGRVAER